MVELHQSLQERTVLTKRVHDAERATALLQNQVKESAARVRRCFPSFLDRREFDSLCQTAAQVVSSKDWAAEHCVNFEITQTTAAGSCHPQVENTSDFDELYLQTNPD